MFQKTFCLPGDQSDSDVLQSTQNSSSIRTIHEEETKAATISYYRFCSQMPQMTASLHYRIIRKEHVY